MTKPNLPEREIRAFSLPDLTESDGNVLRGHAAVFGQTYDMGYFTETIARGAFDSCDFTDVLFSVNHDLSKIPLVRSRNNNANSTLQLAVDDQGLATRAVLESRTTPMPVRFTVRWAAATSPACRTFSRCGTMNGPGWTATCPSGPSPTLPRSLKFLLFQCRPTPALTYPLAARRHWRVPKGRWRASVPSCWRAAPSGANA